MSVPKGKRTTGVFETGTKAKELLMHTLRITKNENCFPVRYRYTVTNRIVNSASEVYGKVRKANAIFPTKAAEKATQNERIARGGQNFIRGRPYAVYILESTRTPWKLQTVNQRHGPVLQ